MSLRSNNTCIPLDLHPTPHSLYLAIQQFLEMSRETEQRLTPWNATGILSPRQDFKDFLISLDGGRAEKRRGGSLIIAKDEENTICQRKVFHRTTQNIILKLELKLSICSLNSP